MDDPIASIRTTVAGRYDIEREIGQGAYATVYLARDLRHERRVAFKILNADPDSEISELRFLREIRFLARLQHPNILPLIDSGHAGATLFYVMPYVSGESLRARMQRERVLPIAAAADIARGVADALWCAHRNGVVHRDIKPENILLSAGHPMVADFGIARAIDSAGGRQVTRTGMSTPGTPAYMSPEMLLNEGSPIDGRSDTYSLGCVLYEMLVGRAPFAGKDGFVRRFTELPPLPSAVRTEVPEELDRIVSRAMARVPGDRYGTAEELCDVLGRFERSHSQSALTRERRSSPPVTPVASPTAGAQTMPADSLALVVSPLPLPSPPQAIPVAPTDALPSPPAWDRISRLRRTSRRTWVGLLSVALILGIIGIVSGVERNHLDAGRRALDAGKVGKAIKELRTAAAGDVVSPVASLWLAQALLVGGADTSPDWKRATHAAAASAGGLVVGDAQRAQALAELADRRYDRACPSLQALHTRFAGDPTITFSLAECIARDSMVVRDPASPSGWRFRGDRDAAIRLYQELLDRLPAGHEMRRTIFTHLPRLLTMEWGGYRQGYDVADTTLGFGGFPSIDQDAAGPKVIFEAHPLSEFRAGRTWMNPPTMEQAWARDRTILKAVALAAVAEEPKSAEAHALLGEALELNGELASTQPGTPSAIEEIRTARALTASPLVQLRLRASQVRLLVKSEQFTMARALSDSAIQSLSHPDHASTELAAPLEALTGHSRRLAALLADDANHSVQLTPDGRRFVPPHALAATAMTFFAYAALGAPRDSILAVQARGEREIHSYAAPRARDSVRAALLGRSLSLAVPVLGAVAVEGLLKPFPLMQTQQALARGDVPGVRARLDSVQRNRSGHSAAAVQLDQVYQEAWLRSAIGDTTQAVQQLDDALSGLPALGTSFLRSVSEAGAVTRAMMLRATLAERSGDMATARRWRAAASALLAGADPELRP